MRTTVKPASFVLTCCLFFLTLLLTIPLYGQLKSKADLARQLLQSNQEKSGFSQNDLRTMRVSSETFSKKSGVTHVYFQQFIGEIPVNGAILNVHVTKDDKLLTSGSTFVNGVSSKRGGESPSLTPEQAVLAAAKALNLPTEGVLKQIKSSHGPLQETVFDKGKIASQDIKVQLIYQPVGKGQVSLAWQVELYEVNQANHWLAWIDARTGRLLDKYNLILSCDFGGPESCQHNHEHLPTEKTPDADFFFPPASPAMSGSYNVYPIPVESPNFGGRSLVTNPADPIASPFGWHDTDGVAGPEFTITRGNNVHAFEAGDNSGFSPDGGASLVFDFPINTTWSAGDQSEAATITNLFFWNNLCHDVWYQYGFDEISGNFQTNNYGNGGVGNDHVNARAQISLWCNATFGTPADGSSPTMNMYIANCGITLHDGSLDNGVVAHEYGHGISNRLVGGPANVSCLGNAEQMGEGWSDWIGLMMTIEPGDAGTDSRGIGTFLLGQPANGSGVRVYPYTTDMTVNPDTYDAIKTTTSVHRTGSVWNAMIWEVTWALIDQYGFDPDFYNGTGGNNIAMHIIIEGMKLTPCSPGFVDARDAILAADMALYGGANQCLIWEAFAKRGLGFSADQGSSGSRTDGTEAFDLPPSCFLDVVQEMIAVCQPDDAVYDITIGDGFAGNVTLSASGQPAGVTVAFLPNPVSSPGTSTMTIGNTGAAAAGTYTITVSGTDGVITKMDDADLVIQSGVPAAPVLLTPADGATDVVNPNLTWNPLSSAETYEVQVATDPAFNNIVISATGLTNESYQTTGLAALTTFYWRVRGVNACGTGMYTTFSFTTANVVCDIWASTDVPVVIPTTVATVNSTLDIASCGSITDLNVKNLDISHTWIDDLIIDLISPAGTTVRLMNRPCGQEDDILINFDDEAASPNFPCPPVDNGNYQPFEALSAFDGENMEGTWTLTVQDVFNADGGSLNNWSLEICYIPSGSPFVLPADGASTVACLAQATQPEPPNVVSCGVQIMPSGPVITDSPDPLTCEGTRTYTWTYDDGFGNVETWSFVYTIEREPFSVPANGSTTVACLAAATTPTPPAVQSNCGETLTPTGPTIVDNPDPLTCEGTRTYTWTYADCEGNSATWSFVYTIEREPFTVPANGGTTVACLAAATTPTPPAVQSNCGETLTPAGPVIVDNPDPLTCEGTMTYTRTYTDCEGNSATLSFVYTIEREPFSITTPNGSATVACLAAATQPTPPVVQSDCGETLTPTGPTIVDNPNPLTCEGTRTYTWTYTDCEGNSATWSFVYTVEREPFTVPANGTATVACPSSMTQPTPPAVQSNCGETLTPTGPVIVNNPNPLTCEGTRTYTWTYTDCEGNSATWSFVYTVERLPFNVPANGTATVACPSSMTQPTPPAVQSNCGETLTPTGPIIVNSPNPLTCEGTRTYTWTYTDCEGNSATWSFVYTVEREDFSVPPSSSTSLECPSEVVVPTPPVVTSHCGEVLTPTGPSIASTTNAFGCEGSRTYTWTYTDCEGNSHDWSMTFNFLYTIDFTGPEDVTYYVSCLLHAVEPVPHVLYNNCGQLISAAGPFVTKELAPGGCSGKITYTYIYTDCGGHSHSWTTTYIIIDDEAPQGTCPNVDENNLACVGDVPCPDDYDFTAKINELLDAGNFFDYCNGNDLVVTLDSWTDLWQCSDADGDGVYTFGRTFYFTIADQCGNEFPELCSVTYSGVCQPMATYPEEVWGLQSELTGNYGINLQTIESLLSGYGPLTIGGADRSLTLTDAQCVADLLPASGNPGVLANCHQVNCDGCNPAGPSGMKNLLASNTIALMLNIRFNMQKYGMEEADILSIPLDCIEMHHTISNIRTCPDGNCIFRIWDANGVEYTFDYTIGGLLKLTNLYLNGGLNLTIGQSGVIATALKDAIIRVNGYWLNGSVQTSCDGAADAIPAGGGNNSKPAVQVKSPNMIEFSLAPNPARSEVKFELTELAESREVTLEIYNYMGQRLLRHDYGNVRYLNERIGLETISTGLYLVIVKAGDERFSKKLIISKD